MLMLAGCFWDVLSSSTVTQLKIPSANGQWVQGSHSVLCISPQKYYCLRDALIPWDVSCE